MEKYRNQLQTHNWNVHSKRKHVKTSDGTKSKTSYCDDILTFDIEVTSAFMAGDKFVRYEKGKDNEYWNSLQPIALPYIWQFSLNDVVYYGREFSEFINVLDDIPADLNCIIWVHNLSYEFVFLSNILTWSDVFARSPHKPMKAISNEYPNIEFRCSYVLTRLSLDAWGKEVGVHKQSGALDYDLLRTPKTPMFDYELDYCEYDCLVVHAGIKKYIERYGTQFDIPLTQTGTVRRVVKDMLTKDDKYVKKMKKLVPRDADEYAMLQTLFAGGYTHANRLHAGKIISGYIEHYDFASSYPAVMCAEKYPSSPWVVEIDKKIPDDFMFTYYAYIMELHFVGIECTTFNTYIQFSKCNTRGAMLDNGRVIKAEELTILATEIDYLTIRDTYEWKTVEVVHKWRSKKEYLPKPFIEYILELYGNKTSLKGVEEKADLYAQSKQYINSMFGMSVTAVLQADVMLNDDGTWETGTLTKDAVNDKLHKLKSPWQSEKRYFLNYSWGIYITSYSRRNLWKCILGKSDKGTQDGANLDTRVLYCDTDSIFVKGECDFKWYNDEIVEKLEKMCSFYKINPAKTRPLTTKGKEKQLGIFEREENCTEFITLGAKRYCERREDGKLYMTISGINKGAVELLNNDLYNFRDGFEFDKDATCVTKRLCSYINDMPHVRWYDGYISDLKHGINLRPIGYRLSMTNEYFDVLRITQTINELLDDENFINHERGIFHEKENQLL